MSTTEKKIRTVFRWTHIVLGVILLCYVYSPFHKYLLFQIFVKFFAIPIIVFSGLWLWQFNVFKKVFRIK